jgi:vesicle-associated membrane protein 7
MHNKHFFFCMTDQQFGRVIPFTYLKDLSQDFFAKYPEEATSYDGLTDLLTSKMSYYNNKELENKGTAGQQKIEAINKQLDGVKDVMKTNLEKALERGERIEVLETRTQELSASAQVCKQLFSPLSIAEF